MAAGTGIPGGRPSVDHDWVVRTPDLEAAGIEHLTLKRSTSSRLAGVALKDATS
jgi:hypothetical protein